MTYTKVVFAIDEEDIECRDEEFYDWLQKQGDKKMEQAVDDLADQLSEYLCGSSDYIYDCLDMVKMHMKYEEE